MSATRKSADFWGVAEPVSAALGGIAAVFATFAGLDAGWAAVMWALAIYARLKQINGGGIS